MAEKVLNSRIVSTHDTEANWNSSSLVPKKGEIIVYDKDTSHGYGRIKVGDGTTAVSSLAFARVEIANKTASSLTIQGNGSTLGTFDGSSTKTINLNYSNVGAAAASHSHTYAGSSSAGGAATSANKVNSALTIQANGSSLGSFDGSAAKTFNITYSNVGAAAASHGTHVSYGTTASALGTTSGGSASTVSRSDHVHPVPALTSCSGTLSIAKGGTGATTAAAARAALGINLIVSDTEPASPTEGTIWFKPTTE